MPAFPALIERFGSKVTPAPRPALPTEPGLYAVHVDNRDGWAAEVFALDTDGWWWKLGHAPATADEVVAHAGTHPLERLIRHGEADQ
jgi:hypothetical protein